MTAPLLDAVNARRVVVAAVGGALIGRTVADIIGLPGWVGGILGGGAPVAIATGASRMLPPICETVIKGLAAPGAGVARVLYPEGTAIEALPAPKDGIEKET